ncbi:MAG TPA: hypothetical protein PKA77_18055 [Chitinophagaceae bacterium]|jgi:hypothetical protein|nr:hypothetical protein [Chitinophagaceae bacterium]HMU60091.1 hypothetical protein [Chitinophagaceae bacterium]
MWPFKKKTVQPDKSPITFTTIICIPGIWNTWDEFILSIVASTNGEYFAVGNILMNAKKERYYTLEFCEHDDRMQESFKYAGMVTRVTDNFLDQIGSHKHVIYISGQTGNLEEAGHIAFAAEAILKAGGVGIKVETTGKAFEKERWCSMLESYEESNFYEMFVVDSIINANGSVYSCGMQNLGYKDTIISGEEFQTAVGLIKIFGYYQIVDKPTIQNEETFSTGIDSAKYRITEEFNQPNKGHEQFENPFGMWRLTKE